MSQQLQSSKYYQEPSEEELSAEQRALATSKNSLHTTKFLFGIIFWIGLFGGTTYMAVNALYKSTRVSTGAGHGGSPALRMLSFCMNLVDFDWDNKVDRRSRQPSRRPGILDRPVNLPGLSAIKSPVITSIKSPPSKGVR